MSKPYQSRLNITYQVVEWRPPSLSLISFKLDFQRWVCVYLERGPRELRGGRSMVINFQIFGRIVGEVFKTQVAFME